jgi:glucose-6-phosphate isomerase
LWALSAAGLTLDYSKNRINEKEIGLFIQLMGEIKLKEKIEAMFSGEKINITENRAVLHTALRNRSAEPVFVDGENVMPKINAVLQKMRVFSDKVRSGEWKGQTGKAITDIVNIGIGGSDLGPKMVCEALKFYAPAGLKAHFVSNVDGTQITETLKNLNPETTLFIIASKTFTTIETLTNAETARDWLLKKLKEPSAVAKHFVAVSTAAEKVAEFGIDTKNMFEFWDWVGGRYSVCSAIGLIIALFIGMDHFEEFLEGAHEMDVHFRNSAFEQNMPVILALLGVWYRNFYHAETEAVIAYDDYLKYFVSYLQQMDMESNGKSVTIDGEKIIDYKTGPVIWGGVGTDVQHSFHQLLHQGTDLIPVDFIVALSSLNPVGEHQDLLFSNCLAQAKALAEGRTHDEKGNALPSCKVMPGNHPSNMILFEKLTPKVLGALIALYEHKVFVQGKIWGVNSFDQWGVELGKILAKVIGPDLKQGSNLEKYDASTKNLIEMYRARQ